MLRFVDELKINSSHSHKSKTCNTISIVSSLKINDFETYTIVSADRIDIVSNKFYGTPDYYWLIALVNNMQDFITDFKVGRKIIIPKVR